MQSNVAILGLLALALSTNGRSRAAASARAFAEAFARSVRRSSRGYPFEATAVEQSIALLASVLGVVALALLGPADTCSAMSHLHRSPTIADLSPHAPQYIPQPPEPIIGIIIARHAEGYRVDIGSSQAASLDALAFEGATKRNKPNLKVGTIVYAHLLATPPFSEPEISCVDLSTQKAAGFGALEGGMLVRGVELGRCRA